MRKILYLIFGTTGNHTMLGWRLFIRQSCAVGGVVKPSQSLILAFVAGFVDTATFVGADGIFSAHITGNLVLFAAALTRGLSGRDYLKLVSFPVFVVAVIMTTYLYRYSRKEVRLLEKNTKLAEAFLILSVGVVCLAGQVVFKDLSAILVMVLVISMALQNAFHRIALGSIPPTTVMTGNVTQFAVEFTELFFLCRDPQNQKQHFDKLIQLAWIIGCFAVGCTGAALLTKQFGMASVILPGLIMLFLSFQNAEEKNL